MIITVHMVEPAKSNMGARIAAGQDIKNAQVCPRMNRIGPLGGTKASEPRQNIDVRNYTDMTRDMIDMMEPVNKRQFATRELAISDEELAKAELRRMISA